ncbi:unnamed protein product [Orchesella dallaii]|uniref:Uncharacterized protein n=1 Tax=Orchesella dallaii TaxID=48710 RepID=A0ABP1RNH3_9HEXA
MTSSGTETEETKTEASELNDANFQRSLFEIPKDLEFPLEAGVHLKGKLHSVLEQNWHLKRHMDYLDKEVIELRKYRSEHREKCGRAIEPDYANSSTSLMTQRIVELSKKNRDLTAQTEGMKTKINKLVRENESLKNMVECFRDKDWHDDLVAQASNTQIDGSTTPGSQQNAQLTNKVIEYRRQNQQLRMELRTALRALSQEVGDGATPHGVLNTVTGAGSVGWRGRQQQILSLQQKVSELQVKLKEMATNEQEQTVFQQTNGAGDADIVLEGKNSWGRTALIQQERKKQERIEKLSQELEQTTKDWKACQQELKANKSRITTLDSSIKTYRSQIEILEGKLNEGEKESHLHEKDMKMLRLELANQKEKERKCRDEAAIEIQEGQRSLQRERAIVLRLQNVLQEKQDVIQRLDGEVIELRNKLDISCSGKFGGNMDTVDRIRETESQLKNAVKAVEAGERERQSLLKMMQGYLTQAEEERQKSVHMSEQTARLSSVLKRAEQCINECLDAGQVTNKEVLQEVEHIRTLIRELKLGDLYVYENIQNVDITKKLKTQVEMMKREIASLKDHLREISNSRKKDLQNFGTVTDQLKNDWAEIVSLKKTASTLINHNS